MMRDKRRALIGIAAFIVFSLSGCGSSHIPNELPIGNVDTPKPGISAKGSLRISGWALSNSGIERIDAYLDDTLAASSQGGVSRPDVKSAYAKYRDNDNSGFDFQVDLSGKSPGTHQLTVQARAKDDSVRELYRYPIIVVP